MSLKRSWSFSCHQFTIYKVFYNAPSTIRVTCPSIACAFVLRECISLVSQPFLAPHYLSPCPALWLQSTSEAAHVKHIQPSLLVCTHCPRLTPIKQSADYTGFIYIDFGMSVSLLLDHTRFVSLESVMAVFPIHLLSSLPWERLSLIVDARYTNFWTTSSL